ncbi:MAG: amino acid permease C-terminal domain-containing protein, partial [Dissulfurimicrobium hydrothermale]
IMKHTHPELKRPFRTPLNPLIPALGAAFCIYLMSGLPLITWLRFFIWLAIGLVIYFTYSQKHSLLESNIDWR